LKTKDYTKKIEEICSLPLPENVPDCAREIAFLAHRQRELGQRLLELTGETSKFSAPEREESYASVEVLEESDSVSLDNIHKTGEIITKAAPKIPAINIKQGSKEKEVNTEFKTFSNINDMQISKKVTGLVVKPQFKTFSRLNYTQISEKVNDLLDLDKKGEGLHNASSSPLILALKKLQKQHQIRKTMKKWIWNLARLFRSSDVDKSGAIDSEEYLKMVESLDVSECLKESLSGKFDSIDDNNSGRINIGEFLNYFLVLPRFNAELVRHAHSNAPFLYERGLSKWQKWRLYVYNMVEVPNYNAVSKTIFCIDVILAIIPTVAILLQSVRPSYHIDWHEKTYLWVVSIFFALQYLCGLLTCKSSARYVKNSWHIIDFVSFAFWIIYNSFLKPESLNPAGFVIFRTLRLLKITAVFNFQTLREDLAVYHDSIRLAYTSYETVAGFMLYLIIFFSLLIYVFERGIYDADTKKWVREEDEGESPFSSFYNCIYFTAVTMTTVGYGDLSPKSYIGKLVALISACCGVCNITLLINIIGQCFEEVFREFVVKRSRKIEEDRLEYIRKHVNRASKSATRGKKEEQMTDVVQLGNYTELRMKVSSESLNDEI